MGYNVHRNRKLQIEEAILSHKDSIRRWKANIEQYEIDIQLAELAIGQLRTEEELRYGKNNESATPSLKVIVR